MVPYLQLGLEGDAFTHKATQIGVLFRKDYREAGNYDERVNDRMTQMTQQPGDGQKPAVQSPVGLGSANPQTSGTRTTLGRIEAGIRLASTVTGP